MNSPRIVVRLAGGLGNQLFQFVAAICLAQRQGLPLSNICIDTRFLNGYESKRNYEIGFIVDLFSRVQVDVQLPYLAAIASRFRLAKLFDMKLCSINLISSTSHLKETCANDIKSSLYILDGYFQHPDILFGEEDRSRISNALFANSISLIDELKDGSSTVGIHIRRGDYITSKSASKIFRNIPIEFYDVAVKKIGNKKKLLVFSDDPKLSYYFANKIDGIDVRQLNLSLQDEFCLLMACDDHIIANSTFSWWAAYLGHRPHGRIIAPKNWYNDKSRSNENRLLLTNFELIDV